MSSVFSAEENLKIKFSEGFDSVQISRHNTWNNSTKQANTSTSGSKGSSSDLLITVSKHNSTACRNLNYSLQYQKNTMIFDIKKYL